ncbi:restriction endonuclease subunit S [Terrimonas ferruginea]|uniref:restriction endonuclease subunit S n=1 Tax=Terrimonas ferruginea TaxID=249 RepID=UPI000421B3A5|nr:restriction endonuclease subunit S [Terrimonas ferruginea]
MIENKLPDSWNSSPFHSLISSVIGGDWGIDSDTLFDDREYSLVYCIRGSELKNWREEKGKTAALRAIKKVSLEKRELKEGDILLEVSGGGPNQPVGRTVIIDKETLSFESHIPKICTNFFRKIRLTPHLDKRYINYYLTHFYNSGEIVNYQGGSNNLRNLKYKEYEQISIPIAPLNEQKRIADKLDNLYHHLDLLNERLDKIPVLLNQFRENVLMQAVTGKLTEEWRENRKIENGTANSSTPFIIPDTWQWHELGTLTKRVSYGTSKKSENEGKVPVLRMGNLQNGKLDWSDLKYSSDEKEIASYLLESGDVLFNRTNSPELVGKTSIYEGQQPAIYAGYIIRVVANEELNPYYLNFVLNSKYGRDWAWQVKSDGVSQSNINAKKLSAFAIPLPEIDEQEKIVKQINDLFSIADRIEILYNELTTKLRKLPLRILGKAFAGQLVNQDPNDEPASLLLQKITQMKAK